MALFKISTFYRFRMKWNWSQLKLYYLDWIWARFNYLCDEQIFLCVLFSWNCCCFLLLLFINEMHKCIYALHKQCNHTLMYHLVQSDENNYSNCKIRKIKKEKWLMQECTHQNFNKWIMISIGQNRLAHLVIQ